MTLSLFSFLSLQHQQRGISPRMLKALVSRGHPEFSSNRQQDAHEFFLHLINLVEVSESIPSAYSGYTVCLQSYFNLLSVAVEDKWNKALPETATRVTPQRGFDAKLCWYEQFKI